MIELVTLFIPVIVVCSIPAEKCELIQYQGYFRDRKTCYQHINTTMNSRTPLQEHLHMNSWCVSIEVPGIDQKYIPKPT